MDAVQAFVRIERLDLEDSGEVQSENDDEDAGEDGQWPVILMGKLSYAGGHRAQRDEDHAETQDEAERVQHDGAQQLAVSHLQGFHAGARDERNITGHERQNAGREEGKDSGKKRRQR